MNTWLYGFINHPNNVLYTRQFRTLGEAKLFESELTWLLRRLFPYTPISMGLTQRPPSAYDYPDTGYGGLMAHLPQ